MVNLGQVLKSTRPRSPAGWIYFCALSSGTRSMGPDWIRPLAEFGLNNTLKSTPGLNLQSQRMWQNKINKPSQFTFPFGRSMAQYKPYSLKMLVYWCMFILYFLIIVLPLSFQPLHQSRPWGSLCQPCLSKRRVLMSVQANASGVKVCQVFRPDRVHGNSWGHHFWPVAVIAHYLNVKGLQQNAAAEADLSLGGVSPEFHAWSNHCYSSNCPSVHSCGCFNPSTPETGPESGDKVYTMKPNDVEYNIYIYNLCACTLEMNNGHDQTQTHLDPSVPTNPRRWFHGQRAVPRCTRRCPRRRCRRRRGGREGCRQPETWWTKRSPWWWLVTLDAKTLKVSWDIWDHWRITGKLWKSIGKSESNKHVWHHQWAGFGGVHQPRLSEEMIKDENRVAMHHKHPWNENRWPSKQKHH